MDTSKPLLYYNIGKKLEIHGEIKEVPVRVEKKEIQSPGEISSVPTEMKASSSFPSFPLSLQPLKDEGKIETEVPLSEVQLLPTVPSLIEVKTSPAPLPLPSPKKDEGKSEMKAAMTLPLRPKPQTNAEDDLLLEIVKC